MSSLSHEAIHALQMARQSELDTIQIYQHMLKQAKKSKTKKIFERLINEEYDHINEIKERLLSGGGELPPPDSDFDVPDREQMRDIELGNCSVQELINLAIENERISRDFYQAQYDRAGEEDVKKIFKWLVAEEVGHIDKLKLEYEGHADYEEVRFSDEDDTTEA